MTRTQFSIIGTSLLLGAALIALAQPAKAGFEFSGPEPVVEKAAPSADIATDVPMPIVPTEAVTAEPLDGTAPAKDVSAEPDHVLKLPVSYQKPADAEPVYIRRQRAQIVMKAPKNQPMDTEALLKATENGDMVELEGQPRPNLAQQATAAPDKLVINPYPLESASGASHGGGMGKIATEQAMMEQGGNLRTIAVPGKTAPGMIARAKMTSRYDSAAQYLDRTPANEDAAVFGLASSMTPIPGGEGEPLMPVEAMKLPEPAPAKAPAPITPAAAKPVPSAPAPRSPEPIVEARISPAENAMPRPAVPEGALPPPAKDIKQPAQDGYAEAVGFGRDLPLALALSQVVPPEYSYAFGQDVNVGSTVSWQGGKPWNEVLDEMLATQGLRAVISGNQVTIVGSGKAA